MKSPVVWRTTGHDRNYESGMKYRQLELRAVAQSVRKPTLSRRFSHSVGILTLRGPEPSVVNPRYGPILRLLIQGEAIWNEKHRSP